MTDRRSKTLLILGVLLLMNLGTADISTDAPGVAKNILCQIANVIWWIAVAGIILLLVMYGIKWASAGEDPEARGAAKSGIIHVLAGAIILAIAATIVLWLFSITGVSEDMDIAGCIMRGEWE